MGDQAPIPIESRVTREAESTDARDGALGRTSSGRVAHEPGHWPRAAAIVVVVGLVAGGLVWALTDSDTAPAADDQDSSDPSVPPDDPQATTRRAFARAMLRWDDVASFAYRGSVRGAVPRVFAPGPWTAGDVTVEGAVLLPHGLARDVATDSRGRAAEMLASGPTVWTRAAASAGGLDGAAWHVSTETSPDRTLTLEMRLVAGLITAAGNPRGEAPDALGRRVIRATLPTRGEFGEGTPPLAGADVLLSLDDAGDIAHMVVTWPAHDPQLVVDLEISGHNEPQDIAPPDRGPAALRRTVPLDDLEAAGVRPLDLGRVPVGWRLTGAWVWPQATQAGACPVLNLRYGDPGVVYGRYLWLRVTPEQCGGFLTGFTGTRHQFTVGEFAGSFAESRSTITGALFDGTTGVGFVSDLPPDDVISLLQSLRPFDPAVEPEPLPPASP